MKVVVSIPVLEGGIKARCHQSLNVTYRILRDAGVEYEENIVENCPYLSVARNTLTEMFLADPNNTDCFFIDSDMGFDPAAVVKILSRPEAIVGGSYRLKRDPVGWTAMLKTEDGIPVGRDGLIEALFLPTGFLRIKREVFVLLKERYPELRYEESVIEIRGAPVQGAYDLFGMGSFGTKFRTEDYAFSQRWRDIGGQLWVYPDVMFEHIGPKAYVGNLHEYLLRQPGGREDPARLAAIPEVLEEASA